MIYVIGPNNKPPKDVIIINTTSRSDNWSRGLSPFFVGPIDLYDGYSSLNLENAWQYSKVYYNQVDSDNNPTQNYFEWAKNGWSSIKACRYPMGKGAIPLYSYWNGKKLDYVSARKEIYIPLYSKAVQKTFAFSKLKEVFNNEKDICLWDFDAHGLTPGTFDYWDLWNNTNIKVGHAYVLAMLLEGIMSTTFT